MACSGLHCSGCAGGMAVPPIAFVYAYGAAWIAEHLVEVAVTSAVCGALAVAAVVAIVRWQDRRQDAFATQASVWTAREIRHGPTDLLASRSVSGLTEIGTACRFPPAVPRIQVHDPGRPAIGPAVVHLHFHGLPEAEQAEAIRRALET